MLRPFVMFAVSDHLSDTAVRLCPAFARGVWIDMLCLMHAGEPYGYLRREAPQVTPHARGVTHDPPQVTPHADPPRMTPHKGTQGGPTDDPPYLPENGSLETLLPALTMTPAPVVKAALEILERRGVFSRETQGKLAGVIYSRRMRRENEARVRKIEAHQRGLQKKSGRPSGPPVKRGVTGDPPQVTPQDGYPPMTPHKGTQSDPPSVPPLRSRSIGATTNPPDPPLSGGAPKAGHSPTPARKQTRGRGVFDDDAIRRRAELNDKTKGKL